MPRAEPPACTLHYIVTNRDAADVDRIGRAIDALDEEEVVGGVWEGFCALMQRRPRRRRRYTWIVLDFGDGSVPAAFEIGELERRHV